MTDCPCQRGRTIAALALSALLAFSGLDAQEWPSYGGDPGGTKFSPLVQINRENVHRLELAWTWETAEEPIPGYKTPARGQGAVRPGPFEATPLMIGDTLYLSTPYNSVVALDAGTGTELWSYDPRAWEWGRLYLSSDFHHRGVATWTDGRERRIFLNSRWRLIALDATTGEPIPTFGDQGEVDLTADLAWPVMTRLHYSQTSPPAVFEDLVIVGSGIPDYMDYRGQPPGDVQAFDARTGERVWSFHTIPQEGEFGNDTWEDGSWAHTGSTNVWGPITVDDERGLVYLPVSTPASDFYGGHRQGNNLFAESIVCLDARTGERVWHFQTVHHGLWDYDLSAPPNLVTITVEGRTIDAVVVLGKTGFAYVFDRVTGDPVWPIEERPVPASDVPGERASPTQPFPTRPAPFMKQGFSLDDLVDFTPELRARAMEAVEGYRMGPIFTPPSLEGTVVTGEAGGANWGGGAFDPRDGVLYVRSTNLPTLIALARPDPGDAEVDYVRSAASLLEAADGIPIHKPPYATLSALDLDTGDYLWQVPLGDSPAIRNHPLLQGLDLPPLGVFKWPPHGTFAGPLATAGGLVFISGGAFELYAFHGGTGETLWAGDLDGSRGLSNPMTYQTRDGRQFVVVATSAEGNTDSRLMAFALPGR
ncbi:MAG TPA: pyrroloquinoline quinone-dependent dehydrogenase [Longimicrobiales bacterium]|nr:pyrroloquinoline quinone-dependent dehydrogenase [Longimicrobiales bacterium]